MSLATILLSVPVPGLIISGVAPPTPPRAARRTVAALQTKEPALQWSERWTNAHLPGSTWRITLNVGREKGTWMPEDWGASGARLSLPLQITFTDEPVPGGDLRWTVDEPACCPAKRLQATAGSFVGAQGEVTVAVSDGGWLAEPADRCGESVVRFYLDFPEESQYAAARPDAFAPATADRALWPAAGATT